MVGTVTDQSDAAVPKAEITATNSATNQTYHDVTDNQGRYSIPDVVPGKYLVKVSAPDSERWFRASSMLRPIM